MYDHDMKNPWGRCRLHLGLHRTRLIDLPCSSFGNTVGVLRSKRPHVLRSRHPRTDGSGSKAYYDTLRTFESFFRWYTYIVTSIWDDPVTGHFGTLTPSGFLGSWHPSARTLKLGSLDFVPVSGRLRIHTTMGRETRTFGGHTCSPLCTLFVNKAPEF